MVKNQNLAFFYSLAVWVSCVAPDFSIGSVEHASCRLPFGSDYGTNLWYAH